MQRDNVGKVNFDMDSVEAWRQKKLVEQLEGARSSGGGTSCISIMVPPGYQMANLSKLLTKELGAASSIKSRVTRNSVTDALKSIQHRVKLIARPPANGLALFCGNVLHASTNGREKKELTVWEPIQPLKQFSYLCDGQFHVGPLREQLNEHDKYGFIVVDGHGALFAAVQGSHVNVLQRYTVALPKKHRRGGQSAGRFFRLRF